MSDQSSHQEEEFHSEGNKALIILGISVVVIVALVIAGYIIFKPESESPNLKKKEKTNTEILPEQQEELNKSFSHIEDLSSEIKLLDGMYNELVLKKEIEPENIAEFVKSYQNYYSKAAEFFENFDSLEYAVDERMSNHQLHLKQLYTTANNLMDVVQSRNNSLDLLPITFPVTKEKSNISSGYGMRDHPIISERRMHSGIDISAPVGTQVFATAGGKVIESKDKGGYGFTCIIEHIAGYESQYSHMVRIVAKKGQWIRKGEVVGFIGNTGLSNAPHLHYEIHRHKNKYNPSFFIFRNQTFEDYKVIVEEGSRKNKILSH